MQIDSATIIKYRAIRLSNAVDFKSAAVLESPVSNGNRISFESDIQKMLSAANELSFITINNNKSYADECFKAIQRLFAKGTNVLRKNGTNLEFRDVIAKETRDIIDYVDLINANEEDFKPFVLAQYFAFDKAHFKPIVDKLVLNRKNDRKNIYLFDEELYGGDFLAEAKETLLQNNKVENIYMYGIDRDIEIGKNSRKLGIHTARKALVASSDAWADVLFSANDFIYFDDHITSFEYDKTSYKVTRRRKAHKRGGVMIFNIAYYKLNEFASVINSHVLEGIYRTDDEAGNLVVVLKFELARDNSNKTEIRKAIFQPHNLPHVSEAKPIFVDSKEDDAPKTFRAAFNDLSDVEIEFVGLPSASDFIYSYLEPEDDEEDTRRALQEPKEGHIPTLATSGIVSGRYVDEVLKPRYGKEIGFDNLIETKIVKREIEEEQMVSVKGKMVKEISLKKSNIIVSTAITPEGEIIELFSNDTEDDK